MAPLLFIFTLKEEYYHLLWKLVRLWSKLLIYGMGFRLNIQLDQVIEPGKKLYVLSKSWFSNGSFCTYFFE